MMSESSSKGFICDLNNDRIHTIRNYPTYCGVIPDTKVWFIYKYLIFYWKFIHVDCEILSFIVSRKLSIINNIHNFNYFCFISVSPYTEKIL